MIILGSSSPRRKELLSTITKSFVIVNPSFNEREIKLNETHYAFEEAYHKALSLVDKVNERDDCLITVDTIVVLDNEIYGKPKDRDDAIRMLSKLSGKTHKVISGYCLIYRDNVNSDEVISEVTFNELTKKEIEHYVDSINVLDKAGAYSVQDDNAFHLIKKISGSTTNVMGFPIDEIKKILVKYSLI